MSLPAGAPEPPGLPRRGSGRSRLLAGMRQEGAKGVAIAVVSTIVVFGTIVFLIVHSPNWPQVKHLFFNGREFVDTFPEIARKFVRNIEFFLIAEVFILAFALLLAVIRSLPGPVFFPLRLMAIVYVDVFRGIPTILVVYVLALGVPGLQLRGVPNSAIFWGIVGLILSYSAYVSEVYRAGIESIHPSQVASARSIGLTRWQSMRFVVLPQAVRRVVPPLLNDFISLQKDTALLSFVAPLAEAFQQAQIDAAGDFNYTPILAAALLFVLITIPMTRLADWLIARERSRRQAGAAL